MSQSHTPGPWNVNADSRYRQGTPYLVWGPEGAGHGAICEAGTGCLTNDEDHANMRRIAACVNACEGVDGETLTFGCVAALIAERNELQRRVNAMIDAMAAENGKKVATMVG